MLYVSAFHHTDPQTLTSYQTIAMLDPSLTSIATPVNDEIQNRFEQTIDAYGGRGGLIQIPPGLIGLLTGGGGGGGGDSGSGGFGGIGGN